jgi:phage gpG-like protein
VTSVAYEVDGVAEVEHDLLGMEGRLMQPRPLLERFATLLQQMMAERFAAQGEGDWAPLAASTVKRKGSSVVGRETDAMMEALTTDGAEGALREFVDDELIFGVNLTSEDGVPYPAIFNDGRGADQPARPLFDTGGMDLSRFTREVQAYLVAGDRSEFGVGSFGMGATVPFGV